MSVADSITSVIKLTGLNSRVSPRPPSGAKGKARLDDDDDDENDDDCYYFTMVEQKDASNNFCF